MGARREARIAVLMALYAYEVGGERDINLLADRVLTLCEVPENALLFYRSLLEETIAHRNEIDVSIEERAENWALDRTAIVDRNILRLGVAEMLYFPDIPPKTTINECIELAKEFGTSESARFVNGLLDGILRHANTEKAKQLSDR